MQQCFSQVHQAYSFPQEQKLAPELPNPFSLGRLMASEVKENLFKG